MGTVVSARAARGPTAGLNWCHRTELVVSSELPSLLENAAQGQLRQLPTDTTQCLVRVEREVKAWQKPLNCSCLTQN